MLKKNKNLKKRITKKFDTDLLSLNDILKDIVVDQNIKKKQAEQLVKSLFTKIIESIQNNKCVRIPRFGKFMKKKTISTFDDNSSSESDKITFKSFNTLEK